MRTIRPIIGTLLAVVVTASPIGTSVVFAAEEDVITDATANENVEVADDANLTATEEVAEDTSDMTSEGSIEETSVEPVETTSTETSLVEVNDITYEGTSTETSEEVFGGEVSYTELDNNISNSYEGTISDNTTVIVRGVPDGDQEETISAIDEYLPKIMETGNQLDISNPGFVDAEKYNAGEKGYDSYHCWVATASNMLWTTGYAQKAVNPKTGEAFKSEDEVLTYFSENFTDEPGDPEAAVEWFFNGTYSANSADKVAQPKSDASNGLLPGVEHDSYMVSVFNDAREMKHLYDIASQGIGVLVRMLKQDENGKNVLSAAGHWVTSNGIVMDNEQSSVYDKLKAIVIADSDNTPANGNLSASVEEKTAAKSEQKNIYSVYKLVFNEELGVWGINNFYNGFGVITHLYGLLDSDKKANVAGQNNSENAVGGSAKEVPAEVQNYVDMINNGEIKVDTTSNELYVVIENANENANENAAQDSVSAEEVEKMVVATFTEKDLMKKENIEMLCNYMIKNNMSAFMVNGGKVDNTKKCTVYVKADDTMIYNVTVDGDAVPFKSFKVIDTKAGVAKIVIEKEYMGNLSKGTHSVQISVENWESPIELEIEVM